MRAGAGHAQMSRTHASVTFSMYCQYPVLRCDIPLSARRFKHLYTNRNAGWMRHSAQQRIQWKCPQSSSTAWWVSQTRTTTLSSGGALLRTVSLPSRCFHVHYTRCTSWRLPIVKILSENDFIVVTFSMGGATPKLN